MLTETRSRFKPLEQPVIYVQNKIESLPPKMRKTVQSDFDFMLAQFSAGMECAGRIKKALFLTTLVDTPKKKYLESAAWCIAKREEAIQKRKKQSPGS